MKPLLKAVAILAACASLHASPLTFDFADPKKVNTIVFQTDGVLESINGTANGVSGTVTVDPNAPENAKGKILVASDSLTVPNPMMKGHLQSDQWLDVKAHPEITFELKEVKNVKKEGSGATADVTGTFTLKGVSKEITVPIKAVYLPGRLKDRIPDKEGDLLVLRSTFSLKRGDYGIKPGEFTDKVSDEVRISLSIAGAAEKK